MKKIKSKTKKQKIISADRVAEKAMRNEDISMHFSGKGKMMPGIQRVNVDFTVPMLGELDRTAEELNVSRQAVIKLFVRQSLDQHLLANQSKNRRPER
ncbi:MAG: hypothetical protein JWQ35_1444 [Bacteriovoracaceae bacterium]|nr:hypothetical protein [Bacteriovoracaceae bacterium]